ncbi:MAG: GIY-YIG nuclease family protein [Negativicutes bacterium]|nr:GIY-YIG nuclease family protein [Negativicutes bacterium]
MEKIIVNWNGPYVFENINDCEAGCEKGLYLISRFWGGKETFLYLGQTKRAFTVRLNEHNKSWLGEFRGQIKVRVGILEFEEGRNYSKNKLSDVEALLINWHKFPLNVQSTKYYYGREKLGVINRGRKGILKDYVNTDDLQWDDC